MKKTILIIVGVAILFSLHMAYQKGAEPREIWDIDFYFTERLFSLGQVGKDDEKPKIGIVQAFVIKNSKNDFLPLKELNAKGELIFETRSTSKVESILFALKQQGDNNIQCTEINRDETVHVLAYDLDLMKVAYFLGFPCLTNDGLNKTVLIVPDRDLGLSVFYNNSPSEVIYGK